MPTFEIVRNTTPPATFRAKSVIDSFDLKLENLGHKFAGDLSLPPEWQIGLIVGASGTGKSTIAKELFPDAYIADQGYKAQCVLDDLPKGKTLDEITTMLNAVGFSSPPSWLKPYAVLSNGEKMRVDVANALLNDSPLVVFDEYTSVVDRTVAKIGCFATAKAIRKSQKKFIAVTCHNDVEEWLQPDWVFNTDDFSFTVGSKKNGLNCNSNSSNARKGYGVSLGIITI